MSNPNIAVNICNFLHSKIFCYLEINAYNKNNHNRSIQQQILKINKTNDSAISAYPAANFMIFRFQLKLHYSYV